MFFIHFCNALEESIEKYLFEYYELNTFFVLMYQGIFGLIFYIIYSIVYNPFKEISHFQKKKSCRIYYFNNSFYYIYYFKWIEKCI